MSTGFTGKEILEHSDSFPYRLVQEPDFQENVTDSIAFFQNNPDREWFGLYRIKSKSGENKWAYATATVFEKAGIYGNESDHIVISSTTDAWQASMGGMLEAMEAFSDVIFCVEDNFQAVDERGDGPAPVFDIIWSWITGRSRCPRATGGGGGGSFYFPDEYNGPDLEDVTSPIVCFIHMNELIEQYFAGRNGTD